MIRGKAKDFEPLLGQNASKSAGNVGKRALSKPAKTRTPKNLLPENVVEEQCLGYLRSAGWTVTRQQSALVRGGKSTYRVGTPGDPDWRCERPVYPHARPRRPECELLYLEIKAPGKKPSIVQLNRMAELDARGFLTVWVDSLEALIAFAEKNLMRRAA